MTNAIHPRLVVVIPCYNEETVLPQTAPRFVSEIRKMIADSLVRPDSQILFVDDGSRDRTWEIISQLAADNDCVSGLRQSRNRGHQNAVWAGMMAARGRCDAVISVDCDGQDDITAMREMVKAFRAGSEIVYGVRSSRKTDTFFKRFTAQSFYRLLSFLGAEVVYNHADYRLVGSRALDALSEFREVNLFLRGLMPLVGFKSSTVEYERAERLAGDSHYPLRKMLALAIDGITSLSVRPLRLITGFGVFVAAMSFLGILWAVAMVLMGRTVAGWASMTSIICFVSGVQLIGMGVIGEYIGKVYLETKDRPRFIIADRVGSLLPDGDASRRAS